MRMVDIHLSKKVVNRMLIFFAIVLIISGLFLNLFRKEVTAKLFSYSCRDNYDFINPLYRCGHKDIVDKKGYVEFKSELEKYIHLQRIEGKAQLIAVWFRDLESGPTFGIDDRRDFIPASLLKLPLALTFYSLAEENPKLMEQTIDPSSIVSDVPKQTFKPQDPIKKDKLYTIRELIDHTLTHSDNVAAQLLFEYHQKNFPDRPLSQTFRDLGILEPGSNLNMDAVNTKQYGSIFRLIYNTSFLNKEASEELLALLSRSEFQDGLVKGVPEDTVVAHKFGERYIDNGDRQLHDCGIIYYPGNPYQLCIMTKGRDYDDLKSIIADISKQVYTEFDSRNLSE